MKILLFSCLLQGPELRAWRSDGGHVVGGSAEFWGHLGSRVCVKGEGKLGPHDLGTSHRKKGGRRGRAAGEEWRASPLVTSSLGTSPLGGWEGPRGDPVRPCIWCLIQLVLGDGWCSVRPVRGWGGHAEQREGSCNPDVRVDEGGPDGLLVHGPLSACHQLGLGMA